MARKIRFHDRPEDAKWACLLWITIEIVAILAAVFYFA